MGRPIPPYLNGRNIDCDAKSSTPFRAKTRISVSDVKNLLRLFFWEGPVSWLIHPSFWANVSSWTAAASLGIYRDRTRHNLRLIDRLFSKESDFVGPTAVELGYFARRFEERYGYLRSHRPGGWHPLIRIHGKEHIQRAVKQGKGIIFWGSRFAFNHLISKMAFFQLGLEVFHFSRPIHGLSHTQFGIRYINPIWTTIERRFLSARVISENNLKTAMQILEDAARAGGAVSITTGNWGNRTACVPFLNGQLQLSTGAIAKSRQWNAVLLPTYVIARRDGSFDMTIGEPLTSNHENLGDHCLEVVRRYAAELEIFLRQDPTQWRGFELINLEDSSGEPLNHRNR